MGISDAEVVQIILRKKKRLTKRSRVRLLTRREHELIVGTSKDSEQVRLRGMLLQKVARRISRPSVERRVKYVWCERVAILLKFHHLSEKMEHRRRKSDTHQDNRLKDAGLVLLRDEPAIDMRRNFKPVPFRSVHCLWVGNKAD